jgi:hypothetical protein
MSTISQLSKLSAIASENEASTGSAGLWRYNQASQRPAATCISLVFSGRSAMQRLESAAHMAHMKRGLEIV